MSRCVLYTVAANGTVNLKDSAVASSQCTGYLLLDKDEYAHFQMVYDAYAQPIDAATAGVLWTFTFITTMGLWYIAKNAGIVIQAVKRF